MSEPVVYVDADACPVKADVARLATRRGVRVVFVGNSSQGATPVHGVEVVTVGDGLDAADYEIVVRAEAGDVVVTDDIGLASMALPKGARCLSSRGKLFDADNIGFLMASREIGRQIREAGGRTKGPREYLRKDLDRFKQAFCAVLDTALRGIGPDTRSIQ